MANFIGSKPPSLGRFFVPQQLRTRFLNSGGRLIRAATPVEDAQSLRSYGAGKQIIPYNILGLLSRDESPSSPEVVAQDPPIAEPMAEPVELSPMAAKIRAIRVELAQDNEGK